MFTAFGIEYVCVSDSFQNVDDKRSEELNCIGGLARCYPVERSGVLDAIRVEANVNGLSHAERSPHDGFAVRVH